jgi:hypothetical protein
MTRTEFGLLALALVLGGWGAYFWYMSHTSRRSTFQRDNRKRGRKRRQDAAEDPPGT